MKRFIAVISVLMAVLTASAAFAVVQDFGEYTVDVIDGRKKIHAVGNRRC